MEKIGKEKLVILKENLKIVSQEQIAPRIFEMKMTGKMVSDMNVPGQFLNMKVPDASKVLRRPISIAEIDKENNTCSIIYRVEGGGTAILSTLQAGDEVDVMGPQGNGFDISMVKAGDHVLVIGGGIGVPPLYQLGKELKELGAEITFLFGYANWDVIIYEKLFQGLGQVFISTDDGSYGVHGHVGHLLDALDFEPTAVFSCGAPGMLKAVNERFKEHPHAYISLESRMACGMGACYACVVPKIENPETSNLRVCEDGPVFKTGSVVL
ncbi:dihydroorotate dehydrogenase electron transfer subunit [Floricoccus tropicus]|uniref:Dihydroorotate dehydrogenase B (NAD(+)), electron transfer subunit n=1 Tax=Floricoccus tropicus TaxID=1859473 RepID=A0A1E8GP21_9LACT|nr:dihydroorotate dehydrogenase electron transfer subunit [Floricoccus tropicus]OFI49363.1 dihydroorotate dehydrogenase electron transfer subunit [Floricoccus tropicus]